MRPLLVALLLSTCALGCEQRAGSDAALDADAAPPTDAEAGAFDGDAAGDADAFALEMGVFDQAVLGGPAVYTVAGSGLRGFADGPAKSAQFYWPSGLAVDAAGRIYVADSWNHRIRVIEGSQVRTFAGDGTPGDNDGPLLAARFNRPEGVAVGSDGRIYVADRLNNRIRVLDPRTERVLTLAGNGDPGLADGLLAAARFNWPTALAVRGLDELLVADSENHAVRFVDALRVRTLAGTTTRDYVDGPVQSARFDTPSGVAWLGGMVYVADRDNHAIRRFSIDLSVETVAGGGGPGYADGFARSARLNFPMGLAVSGSTLYIADRSNHRIRRLDGQQLSTVAGSGTPGYADGLPLSAQFNNPVALVLFQGRIYVADYDNHRIRVIVPAAP
ncbi:MAG: hypothetical protein KC503_06300 [Myxococcales bacterium]|nr:hypothetical protein [Myxococcales bacterium]